MKARYLFGVFLLFAGGLTVTAWYFQENRRYTVEAAQVTVTLSTTDEVWRMSSTRADTKGVFGLTGGKLSVVTSFDLKLPVKSFASGNPRRDKEMYRLLKAYPHEFIRFKHVTSEVTQTGPSGWTVKMTGNLSLAGITQVVDFTLECSMNNDDLLASGSTYLRLSKFGIAPKSPDGAAKVNDAVIVEVTVKLVPEKPGAGAA